MSKVQERICVASDFTDTPGPRSPDEGEFSGIEFLDKILEPAFKNALAENDKLFIDLDDTEGYASSFLEAAFGGLARKYNPAEVEKHIEIKSEEEPFLIDEIMKYIREATKK